jgi:hypothetical protein
MIRRVIVLTALISAASAVPRAGAVDNDSASWTKSTTCNNNSVNVAYWHLPGAGVCYRNVASDRDGNLTSSGDTYNDGVPVGNLSGHNPNTNYIYNFMSISLRMWTGTCYSGTPTSIGAAFSSANPSSSNNLRSLAKSTVTGCGQN